MKTRTEKVNELFRKKQAVELSIKKKLKTIKPDLLIQELQLYNEKLTEFEESYGLLKGNFINSNKYIEVLEDKIKKLYNEFNTYKLNVLYDFEEMNKETYDNYEKKIQELKERKNKIIKKKII